MTFEELLTGLQAIPFKEKRESEADYLEIVITRTLVDKFTAALDAYFGAPLKPEGEKPSKEASQRAEAYGGIYSNQTMYYRDRQGGYEIALLWPWGSEPLITLKVAREQGGS